jgi:hypothetical protein
MLWCVQNYAPQISFQNETFKNKPSNFDSLKICDSGWFNILILCWTPAIIRIQFCHATHISGLSAHMFPGGYHYTTECSELIVLAGDVKVKSCLHLRFVSKQLHISNKVMNIIPSFHQSIQSCWCACLTNFWHKIYI